MGHPRGRDVQGQVPAWYIPPHRHPQALPAVPHELSTCGRDKAWSWRATMRGPRWHGWLGPGAGPRWPLYLRPLELWLAKPPSLSRSGAATNPAACTDPAFPPCALPRALGMPALPTVQCPPLTFHVQQLPTPPRPAPTRHPTRRLFLILLSVPLLHSPSAPTLSMRPVPTSPSGPCICHHIHAASLNFSTDT